MSLKQLIIIFFSLLFFQGNDLISQEKVKKSSGRKPDWVINTLEKNYIIGMGSDADIHKAKQLAMMNIREQIIEAVAVNVKTISKNAIKENIKNQNSDFESHFSTETKTQSVHNDYLKGISISKVDESYWEYVKNKKTKKKYYRYWLKYPFSETERRRLIADFEKKDREIAVLINTQLKILDNFSNIEELESCISILSGLEPIIIGQKKTKALYGIEKASQLLKSTRIVDEGSIPGSLKYSLKIGDKAVTSSEVPRVKSPCAHKTNISCGNLINTIDYRYNNCFQPSESYIRLSYQFTGMLAKKQFYIDLNSKKAEINIYGNITLYPDKGSIHINLQSEYDNPVVIKSVKLSDNETGLNLEIRNIDETINKIGNHLLIITTQPFQINDEISSMEINGQILYHNINSDQNGSFKIYRREAIIVRNQN